MEDKLIFIPDVARMLNRSPAQIRWMVANKTAPRHAKIAGRVCFKTSDVEAFIANAFAEARGGTRGLVTCRASD